MLSKLFIAATVLAAGVNAAQVDVDDYDDMAMQVRLMSNHSTPFTATTTMTFTSQNTSAVIEAALRASSGPTGFNASFINAIETGVSAIAAGTVTLTSQVSVAGRRMLEESAEERELQTSKTLTQAWSASGLTSSTATAAKNAVESPATGTYIKGLMDTALTATLGEPISVSVTTAAVAGSPGSPPAAPTPASSFAAGKSIAFGLYAVMMALCAMMMA